MLRLYDTASGQAVELATREPGKVSMYVCGPTVYEVPHVGHARAALAYDILRRYLEWSGLDVAHVSNITDIDDKIIARAAAEGRSPVEVAVENEAAWWEALDRLGVLRPTSIPHATAYVEKMVAAIAEMLDRGVAYLADDGVYLEVAKVDGYGLLALQPLESLRAGARVEVDASKRSPLDFALWKLSAPGEPSWPSPWGDGRPGWHTECVVMSLDLLGDSFDLHTGGMDLRFPHHENERAQAVALGRPFARHWMHHAFVEVGGEKMSKSLGNFTSLVDLLSRTDGRAYRLLVLRSHYRTPIEVTPATIEDAEAALGRLDSAARRFAVGGSAEAAERGDRTAESRRVGQGNGGLPGRRAPEGVDAAVDAFRAKMGDDLDTPGAIAVVFDLVREANVAADAGRQEEGAALAETAAELAGVLGLRVGGRDDPIDSGTTALAERRDEARAARDFATADRIRDELVSQGWIVEDGPGGTALRRR